MQVVLLSYTPNPELTIAAAARTAYSAISTRDLLAKLTDKQVINLLEHLVASGHLSTFEHASFTFAIDGISRVTSHQLVRHRMASYTQQSQRYVSMKKLEYVTPPRIAAKPAARVQYNEMVKAAHKLYCEMVTAGIPAEDARYVLPQAVETQLMMTMNGRELMHASSLRLCLRAQWEIVQLFEHIKEEVIKVSPFIGAQLNAKCYRLKLCDEVESCGLFPTVKEAK